MEDDMEGLLSAFADGEWDSSDRNFLTDDADFMLDQLFNNEVGEGFSSSSVIPATWSCVENNTNLTTASQSFLHHTESFYTDSYRISPHYGFSSRNEAGVVPHPCNEKYYVAASDYASQPHNSNVPSEYCMMDVVASPVPSFSNASPEDGPFLSGLEMGQVEQDILISIPNIPLNLNLKRNMDMSTYGQHNSTSGIPNKKTLTMKNDCGNKTKSLPKKKWKTSLDGRDVEAINSYKQMSSSSYSSEDDSNAWQELTVGTSSDTKLVASHDTSRKKTGRRGSVIDPQSLYARKRRERINERLRILQNLVPNGTKVDISTMLEEAVSYVKFLQTQVKLLSSDDLWMYAPIAYNGVDVGLDRRLSQNL